MKKVAFTVTGALAAATLGGVILIGPAQAQQGNCHHHHYCGQPGPTVSVKTPHTVTDQPTTPPPTITTGPPTKPCPSMSTKPQPSETTTSPA
jgi:hypothetical protein